METSVESMQAMTIYMLLQAQDTDTIMNNDVRFLLTALTVRTSFPQVLLRASRPTKTLYSIVVGKCTTT